MSGKLQRRIKRQGRRILLPLPYYAIDAALNTWFDTVISFKQEQTQAERTDITTGSVQYLLIGSTPLGGFIVRAVDTQRTIVTIFSLDETDEALTERLAALFHEFEVWLEKDIDLFNTATERALDEATDATVTKRNKPGRRLEPENAWAVAQFEAGK